MTRRGDRRVRRTRTRLKEALLELIEERGYESITVRDLTERADVGRSTFYAHFDSKESLLFDGFEGWLLSLPELPEGSGPEGTVLRFSLPMLRHVRTRGRFFLAVMVEGASPGVRRKTIALLAEVIRRELSRNRGGGTGAWRPEGMRSQEGVQREAEAHALAGAFVGVVSWWLRAGAHLEAERVDRVVQRLARGAAGAP